MKGMSYPADWSSERVISPRCIVIKHDYANDIRQVPFPVRTSRYVKNSFAKCAADSYKMQQLFQKKIQKVPKTGGHFSNAFLDNQRYDALPRASTQSLWPERSSSFAGLVQDGPSIYGNEML